MGLVDHRVGPRDVRRVVVLPVEALVDDAALGDRRGAVLVVELEVGVVGGLVGRRVGQDVGGVPVDRAVDRLGVGVDQQLVGVEAMALGRGVAAEHAVGVALAR